MDWERQRENWPNSDVSRFVNAAGVRWHVQQAGTQGPRVLLLHGTGASLHTWRDLLQPLSQHAQVLAIDLPGHGFSSLAAGQGMSLPGMAQGVAALLTELAWPVQAFIGHSAGAAIAAQMVLDKQLQPEVLIGIGPEQLKIRELVMRLSSEEITEIIVCTNPNTEGEATATYLVRILRDIPGLTVSRIASGLPMGGDLEFADELTLGNPLFRHADIGCAQAGCGGCPIALRRRTPRCGAGQQPRAPGSSLAIFREVVCRRE